MSQDLSAAPWPIRTERLTIRPCVPEDAAAMFAYRTLPEVAYWLPSWPTDPEAYAERLRSLDFQAVTLMMELDGSVIGDLYLKVEDAWAQAEVTARGAGQAAEIGWALDPAHAGRGLALEGASALLRIAFEHLGVRRCVAVSFLDNAASIRLMERLGMRRERIGLEEALHRSGRWMDGVGYAMLASEWHARQQPTP